MTRSNWKSKSIINFKIKEKKTMKTWSRDLYITPSFFQTKMEVYNGHKFIPIYFREDMVGHKLGEFIYTRKKCVHKKKHIKIKKK